VFVDYVGSSAGAEIDFVAEQGASQELTAGKPAGEQPWENGPMIAAYHVGEIRRAEAGAIAEVGAAALMQRAAAGVANVALAELKELTGGVYARRVLLLVGPGNNGGDGLYAGVRLLRRGVRVFAWRAAERVHSEGWEAFAAAGGRELSLAELARRLPDLDLVLDAILGIGGKPGLREPSAIVARQLRQAGVPVVAVDLPSGLDADSGALPADAIAAATTVTFGGLKLCQVLEPAASQCGVVRCLDIGLGRMDAALQAWQPADVAAAWPVPPVTAHKYTRGVVGVDAGSPTYPGAGLMCVAGAVRAGAGMVRYLGDAEIAAQVGRRLPNVVLTKGQVQAWVLGCGWGEQAYGAGKVRQAVGSGLPVVLDADALRYLDGVPLHSRVLLTPHAGEMARLLGVSRAAVEDDPVAQVLRAARETGAVVLLKSTNQLVAQPESGTVFRTVSGPAWTATAGAGDFLAGVCGALLAAGLDVRDAALAGASIQELASRRAGQTVVPQDMELPIAGLLAGEFG
jgi:hydroxyethylthiazole kinase-like uncharacterized protein yjeF